MSKQESVSATAFVETELERQAREVLTAAAEHERILQDGIYVLLAEEAMEPQKQRSPALEQDVQEALDVLQRANQTLRQAYTTTTEMEDELRARARDTRTSRERKWFAPNPPANAAIDLEEDRRDHFAQGINLYKVLLICIVGSFAGVILEMLWCLITNGYIESRAGLVYGPFNLLYGAGAVFLTLTLYKYRNRGYIWSFIGGFVVGSILEYLCSWGQEVLLGSRSWDYSHMPLNLNGRICFMYSVFWGVLGVLWIKDLYPRMAKWILKIPNKIGKPLTWALTVFLLLNAIVSCVAVGRWAARIEGTPPSNSFWSFIDERFTDERMERIFANMSFGE